MTGFPAPSASRMGNLVVNPGSSAPGAIEVYLREWRWWALSLAPFALGLPDLRGENVVIPQADGRRAYAQFLDQGVYTAPLRVTGGAGVSGVEPSGTDPSRYLTQLRTNVLFLRENVHRPPSGATRTARLILPDGSMIDFDAQFRLSLAAQTVADAAYVLDVTVPDGVIA